jgi:hypothetical protein
MTWIATRLDISVSAVSRHIGQAKAKLGEAPPPPKKKGYVGVAERRARKQREDGSWLLRRFEALPGVEQGLVEETLCRALKAAGVDAEDAGQYLRTHGSVDWCRKNLSPEAFGFLHRRDAASEDGRDPDGRDRSPEAYVLGSGLNDEDYESGRELLPIAKHVKEVPFWGLDTERDTGEG